MLLLQQLVETLHAHERSNKRTITPPRTNVDGSSIQLILNELYFNYLTDQIKCPYLQFVTFHLRAAQVAGAETALKIQRESLGCKEYPQ